MVALQFDYNEKPVLHTQYAGVIYDEDRVFIEGFNCNTILPWQSFCDWGFVISFNYEPDKIIVSNRVESISKKYLYIDNR